MTIFYRSICNATWIFYRYEGENEKGAKEETNHLSELLKRIEERKKQREINNKSTVKDADRDKLDESKRKKKKKNKNLSNDPDGEEINNLHTEKESKKDEEADVQFSEMVKTKKKKRKKRDAENKDECPMIETEELERTGNDLENGKESDDHKNSMEKDMPSQSSFMILGAKSQKKQRAVKRVLPDWLAHPEIIPADLSSGPSLEELNSVLDLKLIEVLKTNGIVKLFPVQSSVINWLHKCNKDRKMGWWPRDTCVSAPTGSGKHMQ